MVSRTMDLDMNLAEDLAIAMVTAYKTGDEKAKAEVLLDMDQSVKEKPEFAGRLGYQLFVQKGGAFSEVKKKALTLYRQGCHYHHVWGKLLLHKLLDEAEVDAKLVQEVLPVYVKQCIEHQAIPDKGIAAIIEKGHPTMGLAANPELHALLQKHVPDFRARDRFRDWKDNRLKK